LTSLWQGRVPGGPGEHVPSRAQIPVEFGFDRVEEFGDVLIFIYQDRLRADDESSRIIADGGAGGRIVAVDDDSAKVLGKNA
jgi:hypothetical protein